ncbi:MAG: hypothetical protein EAX95_07285 [Candidatus Thorarchaeota archaeon]|nr:hypothetical protein [Candidatus Thorarchaeota archaeon]
MTDIVLPEDEAFEPIERPFFFQVDAMKALAIFLVILDHSLPWGVKWSILAPFWERISIPLFLIIMGFNLGHSFQWSGQVGLRELYSRLYFEKKTKRFILPLLGLFLASTLLGYALGDLEFQWSNLLGVLPFRGPGNWFVPVILTSIFVLPLIYWSFIRWPRLTVAICLLVDLSMHVFVTQFMNILWPELESFSFIPVFFRMNILTHLFAVGIGIWFSRGHRIEDKRNTAIWVLGPISAIYIGAWLFIGLRIPFLAGDYTAFVYPYSALLFLLGMDMLPRNASGRIAGFVRLVSRSTYHILLFQIFYFSIVCFFWPSYSAEGFGLDAVAYFVYFGVNLAISFAGGIVWFMLEQRLKQSPEHDSTNRMLFSQGI